MPMGAFDAMLKAGPPQGAMENPNAQLVGNFEGANSWLERAQSLHKEYAALRDQYKNASVIPARERARIKSVRSHLDHAINQWQELEARDAQDAAGTTEAMSGFGDVDSIGAHLSGNKPIQAMPGTPNDDITSRLQRRSAGVQKNPAR